MQHHAAARAGVPEWSSTVPGLRVSATPAESVAPPRSVPNAFPIEL